MPRDSQTDPGNWHDVPETVEHDDEPEDRNDVDTSEQVEDWASDNDDDEDDDYS